MRDAEIIAALLGFVVLVFFAGAAVGAAFGQGQGRDAMCAATCVDAAGWSRTGTDCTCLDPVERPARRSRP